MLEVVGSCAIVAPVSGTPTASAPKKSRAPLIVALVVVFGCLPCVGLAWLGNESRLEYLSRAKAGEARANVRAIAQGIVSQAADGALAPGAAAAPVLPRALPPTPATPTPERQAWPSSADPGWAAIGFQPDPVYYSYEYAPDPDGAGFVVRARGDLDGDGALSLFEIRGDVDGATGEIVLAPIAITDELE